MPVTVLFVVLTRLAQKFQSDQWSLVDGALFRLKASLGVGVSGQLKRIQILIPKIITNSMDQISMVRATPILGLGLGLKWVCTPRRSLSTEILYSLMIQPGGIIVMTNGDFLIVTSQPASHTFLHGIFTPTTSSSHRFRDSD